MTFVKLYDPQNRWPLDTVIEIVNKVKEYADKAGLKDVELREIEDQTWSDPDNNRYDITIVYPLEGILISQKLLLLKGEIVNGEEFHKRFSEFYPDKKP